MNSPPCPAPLWMILPIRKVYIYVMKMYIFVIVDDLYIFYSLHICFYNFIIWKRLYLKKEHFCVTANGQIPLNNLWNIASLVTWFLPNITMAFFQIFKIKKKHFAWFLWNIYKLAFFKRLNSISCFLSIGLWSSCVLWKINIGFEQHVTKLVPAALDRISQQTDKFLPPKPTLPW